MAKCKVFFIRKGAKNMAKAGGKATADVLVLVDNQDDTVSIFGQDSQGAQVDISSVATLAVTSGDTTVLTVDPPTGMTFQMHGVKPGHSDVAITATWNDGSIGPFSATLPCDIIAGPATSLVIVPGVPVARP